MPGAPSPQGETTKMSPEIAKYPHRAKSLIGIEHSVPEVRYTIEMGFKRDRHSQMTK